jgi:hypothetical protein
MPRYNLESELLMEDHTKRLATDDVGEGEELSDYILGWVDGLARPEPVRLFWTPSASCRL